MSTPTPPPDFQTWLDYAIATMDARGQYLGRIFSQNDIPSPDDIRAAAQKELDHLKAMAHLPGYRMLQNWQEALSKRLERSAEAIIEEGLGAVDFSADSVRVQFEDGSDLTFRRAFYVGEAPADGAVHRVAVFTEHCGYHELWIGPDDLIEAESIQEKIEHDPDLKGKDDISLDSPENLQFVGDIHQAQSEIAQGQVVPYEFGPVSEQDLAWDNMVPVGREFGSPGVSAAMEKLLDLAKAIVENSTAQEAGFDPAAWLDRWLEIPQPSLGGRKPADLIDTPIGVQVVTRLLGAIESGAYQ